MSADSYSRDPVKVWEKRERKAQLWRAFAIAKHPESEWAEKVKLENPQWQDEILGFLRGIQRVRRQGRERR